ncbi:MAG TPA: PolC-type DNA polymerase III [Methylomusa anaerophila]|uniref:DNA polymerase III PolC-type n=1 Tax=Methylomusa anaerophila TaxID=1930071 RepID=A0A348APZ4_9FIRM|nr:PolC-type DNA polymerase III [Methylomusa anaerophila]BBB93142.1 DNA polymerase III PolC-type [Methylomusa anaerophila]HML87025.1 PolC-type DNA polymerase III [Methylomusa anaerophila]
MSSYCVIPEGISNLYQFIAGLELNIVDSGYEALRSARISKVEINTEYGSSGSWKIFLNVQKNIPDSILAPAEKYLCSRCGLSKVAFVQQLGDLAAYLSQCWTEFVGQVSQDNPAVRHILLNASFSFDGEILSIETVGNLSAAIVADRGIDHTIKSFILREYGRICEIRFTNSGLAEIPDDCESSLMTPEYVEALSENSAPNKVRNNDSPVIFGRNIRNISDAGQQTISSIQDEVRNVVIVGQIMNLEGKELRSGRFLLTYDLIDNTDGISNKVFFDNEEQFKKVSAVIKNGLYVKVKGTVQFDKFSNELVLFTDSMCRVERVEREDTCETPRIELHAHTRMSTLDAVVSIKSLIKTAAKWGHPAVAITDHGVVQAFPEAHEEAIEAGIKIIYGMEGYLFDEDINQARHIVILARNNIGLRNLYRLVSISHLRYLHRTPRIPRAVLNEYREGLILGSACEAGELIQAIVNGAPDEHLLAIAGFYDYLEIQPIKNNEFLVRKGKIANQDGLRQINIKVCELAARLNKPVVATCDVHFLNPEDEIYRRILMAGQGFDDADNQPPLYFRTTQEMLEEFSYLGTQLAFQAVVENPRLINDMVESIKPIPDELYSPQIPGAEEEIKSMSYQNAEALYGSPLPAIVAERLEYELNSIINNGFAVLYLIAHKLVKKSMDDGYLVGSRGSVGSSFVATMTGITEVNPLPPHWRCPNCKNSEFITDGSYGGGFDLPDKVCSKCQTLMVKNGHNIPFAVFMGFHGDKVPDIDLNFSGDYQPVAHKYTEELFGKDNVFRAGTIATIAEKTAYGFVKNYCAEKGIVARNAHIDRLVAGCTGVKRTTGQHPGGIMVVPRDMDVHHFTPIQFPADDKNSSTITTHFDYHSISSRLVKLDILGHDDPTVIKMLEDLTGIDAKSLPFDDRETMSLFSSTEVLKLTAEQLGSTVGTFGIPEFGTKFVRQMLEDTKPKTFSELVRISGFSHGTDVWLNNAQDLIKSGTVRLSEAISTRDDIMVYLIHKGVEPQTAFKIMEGVRKGKGVKPDDVEKMRAKNVPEWYIESCQKIKYMFPKAHAVAYVMMAFRIAYCKVHYPLAFYASYFTVRATEFDAGLIIQGEGALRAKLLEFEQKGNAMTAKEKGLQTIVEMALEMYLRGYTFRRVDLYTSDATKFIIADDGLLPPLASLQGLGDAAAHNIAEARRKKPFSSLEDLRSRARISRAVIDILKEHGCLHDMDETDQIMLFA